MHICGRKFNNGIQKCLILMFKLSVYRILTINNIMCLNSLENIFCKHTHLYTVLEYSCFWLSCGYLNSFGSIFIVL